MARRPYYGLAYCETEAEARLIAAAPDLLAELKWIAGRIDRQSGSPNFTSDEHDRIVAAIAKAEGRSDFVSGLERGRKPGDVP